MTMTIALINRQRLTTIKYRMKDKYYGWSWSGYKHKDSTNFIGFVINIYNSEMDWKYNTMVLVKKDELHEGIVEKEAKRLIDFIEEYKSKHGMNNLIEKWS